jgi:bifunctional non-homologous end joining protein LigD
MSAVTIDKHTIELSNQDKILFPKSKITKGELIKYYTTIAPIMLPHIHNHPIAMQRFPDGIDQEGFYQKDISDYFPSWIKHTTIKSTLDEHPVTYVICDNAATLAYLANQAVITVHVWLSQVGRLHHPDRLIFDLDPSNTLDWQALIDGALQLKNLLAVHDLTACVMTTGSRGLHVVVPLEQKNTFIQVHAFALSIAQLMVKNNPEQFTLELNKQKRGTKIFIDILRNQWAQLAVAPYAVRALESAPVATPLSWQELELIQSAQHYTIKTVVNRPDPWLDFEKHAHIRPKLKK